MPDVKPLGIKGYGSIGHLPGSKRGPSDRGVNDGQARICWERVRDKHDRIIVQEKVDGSNVAVAKIDGALVPINRAGYPCISSPHEQHRLFAAWAFENADRFDALLKDGERVCGEWLALAHGVRYDLGPREPFVVFDIMRGMEREPFEAFAERASRWFEIVPLLFVTQGGPVPLKVALDALGPFGRFGATEQPEGVVYRVERKGKVDYLAKWVRPDFETGRYLFGDPIWHWRPTEKEMAV